MEVDSTLLETILNGFVQPITEQSVSVNAVVEQSSAAVLHGGRVSLKSLVVSCGRFLTSEEVQTRRRGVLLLSELLTRLPTLPLDDQAIHTLVIFFTQRLKDEDCWKEVLLGLFALLQRSVSLDDSILICRGIFDHVTVSSLTQSGRKLALDIIYKLTQTIPNDLIGLGEYTISGLLRCIDGEKDPRNLLITFRLATFILKGSTHADHSNARAKFSSELVEAYLEELFEMTSCYFPITFHPPKNDPIGITGADLQLGLRQVFSAHTGLAQFVLPMMLEKLESSVIDCKLDVLGTLRYCLDQRAYELIHWDPFLEPLQRSLKKEMFHGGSEHDAVILAASTTFSSLINLLCPDTVAGFTGQTDLAPSWNLLMGPLLEEMKEELKMPDSKLARSYASLLQLICATTVNAFKRSMRVLFRDSIEAKFYSVHVQPTQRVAILELLNLLIGAANQVYQFPLVEHPLQPYIEGCLGMMGSAFINGNAEQRAIAVEGMANLATLPPFQLVGTKSSTTTPMDIDQTTTPSSSSTASTSATSPPTHRLLIDDQVRTIIQTLTDRLFTDEDESVRQQCLNGLVKLSQDAHYTPLILQITLPLLFNNRTKALLPTTSNQHSSFHTNAPVRNDLDRLNTQPRVSNLDDILTATSALCRASTLLDATLPHLLEMVQTHFIGALQGQSISVQAIHMVLGCLSEIILSHGSNGPTGRIRLQSSINILPSALLGMLVNGSLLITKVSREFALDSKVVTTAVHILHTLVSNAEIEPQQKLVENMCSLFLDGNVAAFSLPTLQPPTGVPFTPFMISTNTTQLIVTAKSQLQLVPLFTAVIGSYRIGVQIVRMAELIQRLIQFIGDHHLNPVPQQSAIECLAAIVNKLPLNDPLLATFLNDYLEQRLLVQVQDATVPIEQRVVATTVLIWSTKALVMRGHPRGAQFAEKLIQLLLIYPTAPTIAETSVATIHSNLMGCLAMSPDVQSQCDPDLSVCFSSIARGMSVILSDCINVLNRESHANCGPAQLYKQRFFVQTLPLLLALFQSTTNPVSSPSTGQHTPTSTVVPSSRYVILLAVSHLLKHIPHAIVMNSLPMLLPLLLQSLTHPESELRVATLETVTTLLREDVQLLSSHLSTLIPVLLELMRFKPNSCVDDHKREVRQAAARARNQWYLTVE